jgi:hypothetical protein
MNALKSIFPKRHVLLAVVHVETFPQALRNAQIAEAEGADGVFLINHSIPFHLLIGAYETVRDALPSLWVGLNCLDLGRSALSYVPHSLAGLWVDNAGITERDNPAAGAEAFARIREECGWRGLYFGGVAFKYQERVDHAKAARQAVPFVDVITTSGDGTGKAANVEKIREMKEAIGDHPLAIASGITPENVGEYLSHADCFLVATGISDSHTELNPARVRALAHLLR